MRFKITQEQSQWILIVCETSNTGERQWGHLNWLDWMDLQLGFPSTGNNLIRSIY